ncbi:MAG: hypothetical protein M3Z23_17795 [Acidobacteriota bacterium]|nr:hypothetical protein [Acidobacteriota bacterium]
MAILKITGQGLTWIATLVTVLWGCILMETTVVRHARVDVKRSLSELRILRDKRQSEPVSVPVLRARPGRPEVG